jgi:hypothetical protein
MGNAGLGVFAPVDELDLESTVDAILSDAGSEDWAPYTRTDVVHGTHRAVRLDSRARVDGAYAGGSILYVVERLDDRPVVVSLAWDSVTDLGYVEDAILGSFNVDGPGAAVLDSTPDGSTSFVTMTDSGCSAAGPRLEAANAAWAVTVANQTGHNADLNLLRILTSYEPLAHDVELAADAIAAGHEPTWENVAASSWIGDTYLQPHSDGLLRGAPIAGTYAVMCFPVGDDDASLGVHLTLPFEVVTPTIP